MPSAPECEALLAYIAASPTPYHAVATTARALIDAGFRQIDELSRFSLEPGDGAFVTRGGSSLIAFRAGTRPPEESGFALIGAHTDAPNPAIKPKPDHTSAG